MSVIIDRKTIIGPTIAIETVTICNQVWMDKNWDGTTFRNGDIIPEVTDGGTFEALTTPAWCYYNNDPANGAIYGKLYNWYAVSDPRGLAPVGWRVPSQNDFGILETCLGGPSVAGGKLKETGTTHWLDPNTGATNEAGWAGLPGGIRSGTFDQITEGGYWWSTTLDVDPEYAYNFLLYYADTTSQSFVANSIYYGLSVRLIKE